MEYGAPAQQRCWFQKLQEQLLRNLGTLLKPGTQLSQTKMRVAVVGLQDCPADDHVLGPVCSG
jgi:hypothetical protein